MNTRRFLAAGAAILISFLTASGAQAALWSNTITDSDPSTANPYTGAGQTVASNLTVSGIGRGGGIQANTASNRYNAKGFDQTSAAAAVSTGDCFTFTLTPAVGFKIDFTSFVFTGQASGSGPTSFFIRSSVDNFAANIGTASSTAGSVTLGAGFQGITTAIIFEVFAYGGAAAGTYSINDFTFNGAISTAAVLNNSVITVSQATPIAFGNCLVGTTLSQAVTINKTGTQATTYSVTATGNAGVNGVAGTSFGTGTQSDPINVTIDTSASGSRSGNVVVDNTAADSAAAGQGSADGNDTIAVTATVYEAASVSISGSTTLNVSSGTATASLTNAAPVGALRAAAEINGTPTVTGQGFSLVSGFANGTKINSSTTANASVGFNSTGLLNGDYVGGLIVNLQNDHTINGSATGDLGNKSWTLNATVTGKQAASGSATLASGTSLAGRGLQFNAGDLTEAKFLGGTTSAARTLSLSFSTTSTATNDAIRQSDVLAVTGLVGETYVLQLSYNEDGLVGSEADLILGWLNSDNAWVNAVEGNSTSAMFFAGDTAYNAALYSALGTYGVDTENNTVWAVLDHQSSFAVVPEPGAMVLGGLGLLGLLRRRRRSMN